MEKKPQIEKITLHVNGKEIDVTRDFILIAKQEPTELDKALNHDTGILFAGSCNLNLMANGVRAIFDALVNEDCEELIAMIIAEHLVDYLEKAKG